MDKLFQTCQLDEMNPDILSGIARKLGSDTVGFVNSLWEHSIKALPMEMKNRGLLTYNGFSIVPIHERTMKEKNTVYSPGRKGDIGNINYPINRTDSIPVNFKFTIKEGNSSVEAFISMKIPFIGRNGITKFNGSSYYITPILSDVLITPDKNGVFIKPDSIKFKVRTESVTISHLSPDKPGFNKMLANVVTSDQMRGGSLKSKGLNIYGNPKVPVHLYVFFRFGLKKTYGREIRIIHNDEVDTWNAKGFHIYSVLNTKPKGHMKWFKSEYCIAVRHKPDGNEIKIIASVLQVLYHFPSSGIDMFHTFNTPNENGFWEVAIGRMIYKGNRSDSFMLKEVRLLFNKFQTYISGRIANKLHNIGFKDDTDFIVFLKDILEKLDGMKAGHLEYVNSFNYREIDIYYYLLYPYIEGINKIMNAITKSYKNTGGLTRAQFYGITTKEFSNEALLRRISKAPMALTLSKMEACSDNIFFKMCSTMVPQEVGKGVNRKPTSNNTDIIPKNMQGLNASFLYIGNVLLLGKSVPVALASINPFLRVDNNGRFLFTKEEMRKMERINTVLQQEGRNIDNNEVVVSTGEIINDD